MVTTDCTGLQAPDSTEIQETTSDEASETTVIDGASERSGGGSSGDESEDPYLTFSSNLCRVIFSKPNQCPRLCGYDSTKCTRANHAKWRSDPTRRAPVGRYLPTSTRKNVIDGLIEEDIQHSPGGGQSAKTGAKEADTPTRILRSPQVRFATQDRKVKIEDVPLNPNIQPDVLFLTGMAQLQETTHEMAEMKKMIGQLFADQTQVSSPDATSPVVEDPKPSSSFKAAVPQVGMSEV
jgi:hypothetical protein